MLKKLYDKSDLAFAICAIVAYCVLMSVGDGLSETVGVRKSVTLPVAALLAAVLLFFLYKNRLLAQYGLCLPGVSAKRMLWYLPVLVMLSANLFFGMGTWLMPIECVLSVLSMLLVGFLEEVIFRGFLFSAMKKNGIVSATVVSSLTFGIGHIINLFNGSGAELLPTLLQIVYATAAGFMFVMIYRCSGSLLVCVIGHGVFNALSIFAKEPSPMLEIVSCIALTLITGGYALYLALCQKGECDGIGAQGMTDGKEDSL